MNQTIRIILATILVTLSYTGSANADAQQKFSFQGVSYNGDIKPEQFNFSDVIIKVKSYTKRITFSAKFEDISTPYIANNQQNSFNINIDADPKTGVIYAFRLAAGAFSQTIPDHFSYSAKPNDFLIAPMSIQDGKFTSLYNQLTDHDKIMLNGACYYFKNDNNIQTLLSVKTPTGNSIVGQGTNKVSKLLSKPNIAKQIKSIATRCFDATNGTSNAETISFTKYKLCNFVKCVDQYSFKKPSFNGAIKPEQFSFSDVMIKARSNTDRVNIKVIFQDVSTPYKSTDKDETVAITFEGDPESETVYAIRLEYGTFFQTIPGKFSFENKENRYLISTRSVEDGSFNKLYEQLTNDDKVKIKGACHHFMNDKSIEKITSFKSPVIEGSKLKFASSERIDKIILSPNVSKQIKALATLCLGATNRVYVKDVQTFLNASGHDVGKSDGQWGPKSQKGWEAYLTSQGKPLDTTISGEAIQALQENITGKMPRLRKITFQDGYFDLNGELRKPPKYAQKLDRPVIYRPDLTNVTLFDHKYELPDKLEWQPNDETLSHYYSQTAHIRFTNPMYKVYPSKEPSTFKKALEKHRVIDREMAQATILSYLYYDNGAVVYDALPPKDRFKAELNNSSYFPSHSMGKSITSYLIGHAICQGYIKSIDEPIHDWPLMESTLYFGQPLINLLNMKAGDSKVMNRKNHSAFAKTGRGIHGNAPLIRAAQSPLELKDTKPIKNPPYWYSNLAADILFNYMMHRVGGDFDNFISNFYKSKIKIEYPVYLWMNPTTTNSTKIRIKEGAGQYGISATRYDFLRIAKAIMDDWQNDTCEGQYLKELYDRRVRNHKKSISWNSLQDDGRHHAFMDTSAKYGGQFWTDFNGLWNKNILVMNGYNGQEIAIDMDNSRIVVISAVKSSHYNTKKLGYEPIKYGRIR